MNPWVVAAVLVAAVLGLEAAVVRYVLGRGLPAPDAGERDPERETAGAATDDDGKPESGVRCRGCGTVNEEAAMVRYCWQCLARL
jgi:hypothetical protein